MCEKNRKKERKEDEEKKEKKDYPTEQVSELSLLKKTHAGTPGRTSTGLVVGGELVSRSGRGTAKAEEGNTISMAAIMERNVIFISNVLLSEAGEMDVLEMRRWGVGNAKG